MSLVVMSKTKKKQEGVFCLHFVNNSCIREYAKGVKMSSCVQPIKKILEQESCTMSQCPFDEQLAVNLDAFELSSAKKSNLPQSSTVDCVVGLGKNSLLMVEMKFSVQTVNMNKIARNVKKKKVSSHTMLGGWQDYVCLNKMVVLLSDDNFERQKNSLCKALGMNLDFEIMRVTDFYKKSRLKTQKIAEWSFCIESQMIVATVGFRWH